VKKNQTLFFISLIMLGCAQAPGTSSEYLGSGEYSVRISPVPKEQSTEFAQDPLNYYQDGFSDLFFN